MWKDMGKSSRKKGLYQAARKVTKLKVNQEAALLLTQRRFLWLCAARKEVLPQLQCCSVQLPEPRIWTALVPTTSPGLPSGPFTWKTKGFSCAFLYWQQHLNMLKRECLWVTARHGWRTTHQNMAILFHRLMNQERKFSWTLTRSRVTQSKVSSMDTSGSTTKSFWVIKDIFLKKSEHLYIGRTSNNCRKTPPTPKIPLFSKHTLLFQDAGDGVRASQCVWDGL